jgi:hypothetical protein
VLISTHFVYAYCFVYIVNHICDFEAFGYEKILFFLRNKKMVHVLLLVILYALISKFICEFIYIPIEIKEFCAI